MKDDSQNLPQTSQNLSSGGNFEKLDLPRGQDAHVWLHRSRRPLAVHRHAELEANLILSGRAVYLVDGRHYRLSRRTFIWLFPAQNHILIEPSPDFSMHIAVWKPGLVQNAVRSPSNAPLLSETAPEVFCRRLETDDFARLEVLCTRLINEADPDFLNAGSTFLLHEFWRAFKCGNETVAGRAVHPAIERAARILSVESMPLPELAHSVGLSESRLSGQFKVQIGQSVSQFRAARQIDRFLKLYDGRNFTLGDAAREVGFGSYAQFHRVFRETMGVSPAQWREKLRDED